MNIELVKGVGGVLVYNFKGNRLAFFVLSELSSYCYSIDTSLYIHYCTVQYLSHQHGLLCPFLTVFIDLLLYIDIHLVISVKFGRATFYIK